MLIKCHCQTCSGYLEFESANAGQTVTCPDCGFDTLLFIPQSIAKAANKAQKPQPKIRFTPRMWSLIVTSICLLAGAGLASRMTGNGSRSSDTRHAAGSGNLPEQSKAAPIVTGLRTAAPIVVADLAGSAQTTAIPVNTSDATNAVPGAAPSGLHVPELTLPTPPLSQAANMASDGSGGAIAASNATVRPTEYTIDNRVVTGIERVRFEPKSGKVLLFWTGGGGAYPNQKFSDEFLTQWGVDVALIKAANERARADRDRQEKARLAGEQVKDDEMRASKGQSESDRSYMEQERARLRAKLNDPSWRRAQISAIRAKYLTAGGAMASLANDDAFLNKQLDEAVINVLAQSTVLSADYVRRMGGLGGF